MRFITAVLVSLAAITAAPAADSGKQLLDAARDGASPAVRALLETGANIEARDKNGRTPLMLAAEEDHAEIVRMLLEKGADPQARDKEGYTAYALALLASPGKRSASLALLPAPPVRRIDVNAAWLPDHMSGSCFLSRGELAQAVGVLHPDGLVLGALAEYARGAGGNAVDIVRADNEGLKANISLQPGSADVDATVTLAVRPGVACNGSADNLTLEIDVRVTRTGRPAPDYQKNFGGGLKGLHAQPVTNPGQYSPFFEKWAKSHADSIYWGVMRALLKM